MEITQEAVAAAVGHFSSVRGQGTLPNLLAFGRALKQLGVKVSLSGDRYVAPVELVDVQTRQTSARHRSNLISQRRLRRLICCLTILAGAELRTGADGM
jgi:hypothetical protein